ncbi:MAG: VirB3 family type IV secretion system protein [Steroidobacteraceae bacterium]
MRWGVTYSALLVNLVVTLEASLVTRNLLTSLLALPIHGICALLCARDTRFLDLVLLRGRTRIPALLGNARFWRTRATARFGSIYRIRAAGPGKWCRRASYRWRGWADECCRARAGIGCLGAAAAAGGCRAHSDQDFGRSFCGS